MRNLIAVVLGLSLFCFAGSALAAGLSVDLISPSAGAQVSGNVPIRVSASGPAGSKVSVAAGGVLVGEITLEAFSYGPYEVQWNTKTSPNGMVFLLASVTAPNGSSVAKATSVVVNNAPTDTKAPSKPGNFRVDVISPTEVKGTWEMSTDNVGVAGYRTWRGNDIIPNSGLSFRDSGLKPGSTHMYSVEAFDVAGNVSEPAVTVVTLPEEEKNPVLMVPEKYPTIMSAVYYSTAFPGKQVDILVDSGIYREQVNLWGFFAVNIRIVNRNPLVPVLLVSDFTPLVVGQGTKVELEGVTIVPSCDGGYCTAIYGGEGSRLTLKSCRLYHRRSAGLYLYKPDWADVTDSWFIGDGSIDSTGVSVNDASPATPSTGVRIASSIFYNSNFGVDARWSVYKPELRDNLFKKVANPYVK